jgi:predicted 3-demethylubiquinone-9 3-methyltransferase (glyoxalase superfamily)
MKATFSLGGQIVMCIDSVMKHNFTFTLAISFFVTCETEQEIQSLSSKLLAGGAELMPLGDYGFSRQSAWVTDRFGISWQLNLD